MFHRRPSTRPGETVRHRRKRQVSHYAKRYTPSARQSPETVARGTSPNRGFLCLRATKESPKMSGDIAGNLGGLWGRRGSPATITRKRPPESRKSEIGGGRRKKKRKMLGLPPFGPPVRGPVGPRWSRVVKFVRLVLLVRMVRGRGRDCNAKSL